jgi:hypothetical protein
MDLREWGCGAGKMEMGGVVGRDMTDYSKDDHSKNLLIVVAFAGYASLLVADWYGYIKEPYVTLIKATASPAEAAVRAGFLRYRHPVHINDWLNKPWQGYEKHP